MASIGLRHQGLYRQADAAEKQPEYQYRPIYGAYRRWGRRRDAADEPGIGGIEQRLNGTVDHERKRQARHRRVVEARPAAPAQRLSGQQFYRLIHSRRMRECLRRCDAILPARSYPRIAAEAPGTLSDRRRMKRRFMCAARNAMPWTPSGWARSATLASSGVTRKRCSPSCQAA